MSETLIPYINVYLYPDPENIPEILINRENIPEILILINPENTLNHFNTKENWFTCCFGKCTYDI